MVLFLLALIFALIVLLLMRFGPGRREFTSGTDSPGGVGKLVYLLNAVFFVCDAHILHK